ncbi:protein brown-like isoform X2 [Pieris napi]|uniref:protein brown-like isoform X2 n=1 Tax=Pieris napi TaxID=78633 RepID=UPI001FBAC0D2|nr:protein brown-like isoform X2 [Pieris napi]
MELLKLKEEENEIVIRVNNLTVSTREEKSWWRRKATRSKTTILNNVSVCMKTGDFVAVIGPSGAGKTTFLTSLAGKCNLVSSGSIAVNNTEILNIRSGLIELVPQFDVFMDHLTVSEHLIFMTEMKLGSVKKEENRNHLTSLILELKLKPLENNTIRSLSGGEKRLLSLATSLILSPIILICDEPTTGLDSYNASLVIGVLKKLSQGKIVICSVHQPSSDLFNEFNSVCLMSEGNVVFCGSQSECKKQFERLKLYCPVNFNPAEFYIRAISNGSVEFLENNQEPCFRTGSSLTLPQIKTCQRNWFKQIQLLIWRSSLSINRDFKDYLLQLFVCTLPKCLIWPIAYVLIVTLAVELPNYILTAFKFSIALIITAIASSAYGLGMGALFTSTGVMGDVMPCADLPLFIMSGAFIRLSSLPIWLLPLKYISHFYYGMDAVSNIYWRQIDAIDCPTNSTSICYKDGIAVLTESGYSNNISENYLGFAFVIVLWNLLGYYGLKREENKGYIY